MLRNIQAAVKKNTSIIKIWNIYKLLRSASFRDYLNREKMRVLLKVRPYTMVSYYRLLNLYDLSEQAEKRGLQGAFVECGVWRGGCAALMAYVAKSARSGREIWLFDSFEGLPEPSEKDGADAASYASGRVSGALKTIGKCVGPMQDVNEVLFERFRVDENNIVFRKGWFQNTLPGAKAVIGPIAILRLDCDWYESTMVCLENLYDRVTPGGFIIVDDYLRWDGCRKAVDEYLLNKNIKTDIIKIDASGVYFRKPRDREGSTKQKRLC
jgi:hypothetical protein